MNLPLIIHDLHDSQMFAIAQAAGRAGISVEGTFWPMERWGRNSRYIQRGVEIQCLSEQLQGTYALQLKNSGLSGVWLPCVDDLASFTAKYQGMLKTIGMRFISVDSATLARAFATESLPETKHLKIAPMEILQAGELFEHAERQRYPLMVKSERDRFQKFDSPEALREFLESQDMEVNADHYHRIQQYIEGDIESMATALLLFDEDSRPVRGFTGRRLRVSETRFGPFGETTAAKAEWIPELYEGARDLLSELKWKGFAEVECKQDADGQWNVMEVNPRLSGWSCLAEADGAGMISAYYQMCSDGWKLQEACLQRSKAEYVRAVATCYHDPEWAVERSGSERYTSKLIRLFSVVKRYRKRFPNMVLGAWDGRDLFASMSILWSTVCRVWKKDRIMKRRAF